MSRQYLKDWNEQGLLYYNSKAYEKVSFLTFATLNSLHAG